MRDRAINLIAIGAGIVATGFGLAAAGLLPRLDVTRATNLRGGRYDLLEGAGDGGWRLYQMLGNVLDAEFVSRRVYLGTGIVVLALLAPLVARRRFAVPFFSLFTLTCLILILFKTVVHEPFYLLPRFQTLHSHSNYRILGIAIIGPAILAAATVDRLTRMQLRPRWLLIVPLPGICYWVARSYLSDHDLWLPRQVWVILLAMTALLGSLIVLRLIPDLFPTLSPRLKRLSRGGALAVPWIMVAVMLTDAIGIDMVNMIEGNRTSASYFNAMLKTRERYKQMIKVYTQCEDPGGAGEFLQGALTAQHPEPVRYFRLQPDRFAQRRQPRRIELPSSANFSCHPGIVGRNAGHVPRPLRYPGL